MSQLKDTIHRLKILNAEREALNNIPQRIKILELEYDGIKAAQTDSNPISGGENKREEVLLNNILNRQNLMRDYERTKLEVEQIEGAMATLTFAERRVLELFFINRPKEYIEILSEELRCERPTVYRLKDKALLELTRSLCGQVNL